MSGGQQDTIVAIATPPGRGGIGVVRVSGPLASAIAGAMLGGLPKPRLAIHRVFRNAAGEALDDGIALWFPAPHSFTGEDVLELQGHGGPVVLDGIVRACLALGARLARPGEFSERAFLNDKLDLAQAEAIADLIDAGSEAAAKAALASLQGAFSREVHDLTEQLIQLRMYIEAALDFPEEEIDFLADQTLVMRLDDLLAQAARTRAAAHQGALLREGLHVVILGQPNVGKSSLLNALCGVEAAIVTDIPGTTRDVLRQHLSIDGLPLHLVDTAGLRESVDVVEQEGIRRAWLEVERADRVLLVVDDQQGIAAEDAVILQQLPANKPLTLVRNKIDISGRPAGERLLEDLTEAPGHRVTEIALSAKSGEGLDLLREHLKACLGYQPGEGGVFLARRRHLDALERAEAHMHAARANLLHAHAGELAAEELRLAQEDLGEITGRFTSDDLLGRIFSSFCIGK
ncbi:MAG: tRNA uridine-5-carboxymethylaminomethyl(34) synthesis GTPase MnmE [Gammaproteobacteria bacterium]|nr:tRNA uridine-5-carboxymethylaminomethyl(34) synthesis GTPase MnmE [Gammaproteobacteria bacterium]